MEQNKKKLRIKLLSWIAALCIAQLMVEKVFFDIPKPMMDKDIEFYQPKSELESNLREMNLYIHEKNLISKLSIETGEKTVNDEYMAILREYHSQMLELYNIISSKPFLMSIEKMSNSIGVSVGYTNSEQCLFINNSKEIYNRLVQEYPSLIEKLSQRPDAIMRIHQRIYSVKPEKDESGEYNVDGMIERMDIIRDLMEDPYLAVRKNNTEALQEINQFLARFDDLHAIYTRCAESYNREVKNMTGIRDVVSFLIFIVLTLLVYRKEIIS
ncbi:hypothetical protein [Shewanella algae]|uniref:hypothetical protein n=1 Tax=Shewanella algae TaxID=38313 RepID=UPI001182BB99|nr:hypothetical protein [Shewanella algae]QGS58106.1 hypothetical protein GMX02_00475 [Shewanella algae]TVL10714.1 hypothetical protein AYJ02_20245 [Shewanella algae]WKC41825.1 hypothetical protein QYM03_21255 [Shewanella algae]